jgi:predicted O-methyltransferase YrrM
MSGKVHRLASRIMRRLNGQLIDVSHAGTDDSKWHQGLIIHLASIMRPKVYLELGIFRCGLFNQMVPFADRLIGVDANPEAGRYMTKSPKTSFIAATTSEFARQLRENPIAIDMAFIDADHSREAVLEDFRGVFPFVVQHGLILLHDTHPVDEAATDPARCGDGYQAIAQLSRMTDEFEMMTLPRHPGLTLCRKRTAQLSWQEGRNAAKTARADAVTKGAGR